MANLTYCILLGLGGENEKAVYCEEKDYKVYVWKEYHPDYPQAFSYNFCHVTDDVKEVISEAEIDLWMQQRGITEEDCNDIASWFILEYLKCDELRYFFPALNLEAGPDPVFIDDEGNVFEL